MITSETRILSEDQWHSEYEPEETLYETYGDDLSYIHSLPVSRVWTLVDGDENTVIINGMGFVNRIGYYVSKKPHNQDDLIVVELDTE